METKMSPQDKIEQANKEFLESMNDNDKAVFERTCELLKPLIDRCNRSPGFVTQAANAYYRVITMKHDSRYRAIVTMALLTQGANLEAMKEAVLMQIRDEN